MTDADLTALWSAWFKDRTLHRGCIVVSAILRATVERAAMPPLYEVRVSDDGGLTARRVDDPTGTDPYPPQLKPPQTDTRGERTTYVRPLDPPHVRHDKNSPLLRMLDSGPHKPTNPADDCGDMA